MQILAGIVLLGVLVTFHELGHFLFAKWLGVRVLVFSVGFGPKIFGFKKGETEYRLSAIPLGGYVRMFGESLEENLTDDEKKMSFMHQAIWRKSLIAFAGPLFNFILPIILFFALLIGSEQIFAPRIGTLMENGIAQRAGLKVDDKILAINAQSVTSFNEVAEIIANNPDKKLDLLVARMNPAGQVEQLTLTVQPEAKDAHNPLEKGQKVGRIGIMPSIERAIVMVSDASPLKAMGLQSFDEIASIDGKPIASISALNAVLPVLTPSAKIDFIREGHNQTLTVTKLLPIKASDSAIAVNYHTTDKISDEASIEATKAIVAKEQMLWQQSLGVRSANGALLALETDSLGQKLGLKPHDILVAIDGEKLITTLQLQQSTMHNPDVPHILGVMRADGTSSVEIFKMPKDASQKLDADAKSLFGLSFAEVFKSGEIIVRQVGPFEALKRATVQTADIGVATVKSLWLLVKREVPASQIGGPIMLFDVAQQAAQKGLSYYILIMCLLSVNLGLLNLLPIPALDGGHLLLFGIEAVQRKPLTQRTRAIATQIGIVILLLIMAIAIFNDLSRLFS